ncbi:phage tail assembly chaperone [Paracoccus aestuariivivens]|uniref:Phage tail assembly chaperone n=1 Tax=Paracoccus aestuariivivens TaxID=1820333 RepID=A0A6L6J972_9RHOB|nr:phage tail assembly chaperone [Paracoccus aestuariivivens]MTH77207.1 phage tail assembly chaperone [Paracoccus aestuariivivens]
MARGLDWLGLMKMGLGPERQGGLGLAPSTFWSLTPAELALMLGIEAGSSGMTRNRLTELAARYPDIPRPSGNEN